MGRLNLTALNVRQTALAKLRTNQIKVQPPWIDIMADVPPAQILIRNQPTQHPMQKVRTRTTPKGKIEQVVFTTQRRAVKLRTKSQRNLFKPIQLRYEEDSLRRTFYSDHPWELARPRVILETSGNQHEHADWSTGLLQPGIPLSGESVVQRQLHLLATVPDLEVAQAYDIARKEFYALRRQEERRDRIAEEEARHNGAQFGPSLNKIALGVENAMYDNWEAYAREQVFESTARLAAFEGSAGTKAEEDVLKTNYAREQSGGEGNGDDQDPLREVVPPSRPSRNIGQAVFAHQAQLQASRGPGSGSRVARPGLDAF